MRWWKNICEDIVAKSFLNLGKEINIQVQEERVPNKTKPKRSSPRPTVTKWKKRKRKKRKRNKVNFFYKAKIKQLIMTKQIPMLLSANFQQKLCKQEGSTIIYLEWRNGTTREGCWQGFYSDLMERPEVYRQAKANSPAWLNQFYKKC